MKMRCLKSKLVGLVISGMLWPVAAGWTQNLPAAGAAQPATASVPAVELSPGGQQVLQLHQARVSDDTIIAFIHNSSVNYHLDANAIIYLEQAGVSSPVLTAMLNQPAANPAVSLPATPAPAPAPAPVVSTPYPLANPAPVVYPAPPVTVIPSAPATVYYGDPNYYAPYSYGFYPSVGLYFGGVWGGGYYGGGGYHGGYYGGGYHGGGGGYHGGGGGGGGGHGDGGGHH